jgi:hypothetical protein
MEKLYVWPAVQVVTGVMREEGLFIYPWVYQFWTYDGSEEGAYFAGVRSSRV